MIIIATQSLKGGENKGEASSKKEEFIHLK
jgi:hypothetical protein